MGALGLMMTSSAHCTTLHVIFWYFLFFFFLFFALPAGLAICRDLVESMRMGKIGVRSKEGTVTWLLFVTDECRAWCGLAHAD